MFPNDFCSYQVDIKASSTNPKTGNNKRVDSLLLFYSVWVLFMTIRQERKMIVSRNGEKSKENSEFLRITDCHSSPVAQAQGAKTRWGSLM